MARFMEINLTAFTLLISFLALNFLLLQLTLAITKNCNS